MKRTRHSVEQIVTNLREAEAMLAAGRTVAQVVQALGVSEPTFNHWRNQYGGIKVGGQRESIASELVFCPHGTLASHA